MELEDIITEYRSIIYYLIANDRIIKGNTTMTMNDN